MNRRYRIQKFLFIFPYECFWNSSELKLAENIHTKISWENTYINKYCWKTILNHIKIRWLNYLCKTWRREFLIKFSVIIKHRRIHCSIHWVFKATNVRHWNALYGPCSEVWDWGCWCYCTTNEPMLRQILLEYKVLMALNLTSFILLRYVVYPIPARLDKFLTIEQGKCIFNQSLELQIIIKYFTAWERRKHFKVDGIGWR